MPATPEYNKKYYQEHKEYFKKTNKEWYENHKQEKYEYNKKFVDTHKEDLRKWSSTSYQRHKEERLKKNKEYVERNKAKVAEYKKEWAQTKEGKASSRLHKYKLMDKKYCGGGTTLTRQWIIDNIFSGQKCYYCGNDNWKELGCDRIDNSKPHTPDNVICSCGVCNLDRRNRNMSVEEYLKYKLVSAQNTV